MAALASLLLLSLLLTSRSSSLLVSPPSELPRAEDDPPINFRFGGFNSCISSSKLTLLRLICFFGCCFGCCWCCCCFEFPSPRGTPMSLPSRGVIGARPLLESPVELAGLFLLPPLNGLLNGLSGTAEIGFLLKGICADSGTPVTIVKLRWRTCTEDFKALGRWSEADV